MANKMYLGDSVYADFSDGYIILTTENGYGPSNTIALEYEVLEALDLYRKKLEREWALANVWDGSDREFDETVTKLNKGTP